MYLKVCDLRTGVSRGHVYLNTDMYLKVCDLRVGVSRGGRIPEHRHVP